MGVVAMQTYIAGAFIHFVILAIVDIRERKELGAVAGDFGEAVGYALGAALLWPFTFLAIWRVFLAGNRG